MRTWLSLALETALAAYFVYWLPRSGAVRMREHAERLRARPFDDQLQVNLAKSFAKRWWPLAVVCGLVLMLDGARFSGPPVATFDDPPGTPMLSGMAPILVGVAVASMAISMVLLARVDRYRARTLAGLSRLKDGWVLFPRSAKAARWFVLVAITAGVCEEIAFRRLLPVYIVRIGGDATFAPFIVSSIAFGLGHRYQGSRGMVLTGLLGFLLYGIVGTTGALWPAMCVHALIDLRVAGMYPVLGPIPIPASTAIGEVPEPPGSA